MFKGVILTGKQIQGTLPESKLRLAWLMVYSCMYSFHRKSIRPRFWPVRERFDRLLLFSENLPKPSVRCFNRYCTKPLVEVAAASSFTFPFFYLCYASVNAACCQFFPWCFFFFFLMPQVKSNSRCRYLYRRRWLV